MTTPGEERLTRPRPEHTSMTEAQFTKAVIGAARAFGWLVHHDEVSAMLSSYVGDGGRRRWRMVRANTIAGFPDLVLVHPTRRLGPLYRELKTDLGPRGGGPQPTPEQVIWLDALRDAGADVGVWRPSDLDAIYAYLAGA